MKQAYTVDPRDNSMLIPQTQGPLPVNTDHRPPIEPPLTKSIPHYFKKTVNPQQNDPFKAPDDSQSREFRMYILITQPHPFATLKLDLLPTPQFRSHQYQDAP